MKNYRPPFSPSREVDPGFISPVFSPPRDTRNLRESFPDTSPPTWKVRSFSNGIIWFNTSLFDNEFSLTLFSPVSVFQPLSPISPTGLKRWDVLVNGFFLSPQAFPVCSSHCPEDRYFLLPFLGQAFPPSLPSGPFPRIVY